MSVIAWSFGISSLPSVRTLVFDVNGAKPADRPIQPLPWCVDRISKCSDTCTRTSGWFLDYWYVYQCWWAPRSLWHVHRFAQVPRGDSPCPPILPWPLCSCAFHRPVFNWTIISHTRGGSRVCGTTSTLVRSKLTWPGLFWVDIHPLLVTTHTCIVAMSDYVTMRPW